MRWLALATALLCLPEHIAAQGSSGSCGDVGGVLYDWVASGQIPKLNNCQGSTGCRCYDVENPSSFVEKLNPSCNPSVGSCSVRLHATATIPGVREMVIEDGLGGGSTPSPWAQWYGCLDGNCGLITTCGLAGIGGQIGFDDLDAWAQRGLRYCALV